jgi:PPOX class probable F420-dependent enzyme
MEECWLTKSVWKMTMWTPARDIAASFGRRKQMKIPQSIGELIAKAPFAHLTTLNSTGGPQVTVVWVGIEGEDLVVGHLHLPTYQKVKNIRRDPRVALSMLSDATNAQGLREYLVVHGDARVTEGGAFDLLQRLGRLYLGPNAVYPPAAMSNIPGWITRITPARYAGVGPWVVPTAHE